LKSKLKILFIGTYVPRECGIATFTSDLFNAISKKEGVDLCEVMALNDIDEDYDYPEEVVFEIRRNKLEDYYSAADFINRSDYDVVCLQHEFGLYWGDAGDYIFALLSSIDKPIITTLHTVIREPEPSYRRVTEKLMQYSDKIIIMSDTSGQILQDTYNKHDGKIELVYHGIPDCPFTDSKEHKELLGLEGSPLVLTFGLLNPNKGVETTLDALPEVVKRRPELKYLVLGATHPEIKRNFGEAYREYLIDKVHELGLERNVIFHDKFVEKQELYEYILASDIYVSPYHSKEQVVSGALSYAIGLGKAIISTPYWYAQDMIKEDRGILVDFEDSEGISKALLDLIENPQQCNKMRRNAYDFGRQMIWKNVARDYIRIFREALEKYPASTEEEKIDFSLFSANLPETNLNYMISMTDDVGIFQHATYGVPSRQHGYSTDDVGRGLVALTRAISTSGQTDEIKKLVTLYLSYLDHAQTESGHFHNFMSYDRKFLDEKGSDDTFGRALYGLGHACACSRLPDNLRFHALDIVRRSRSVMDEIHAPRAKAYTMTGLYEMLEKGIDKDIFLPVFVRFADYLTGLYEENRQNDWEWFETEVTYGNAKMCEALMLAYKLTGERKYREVGLETLDFLTELQWNGEFFDLVGNEGWCTSRDKKAVFGQQPIDAGYLTEAYVVAYELTDNKKYLDLAHYSMEYFLGRNRLKAVMYDHSNGAVCDGLDLAGMNPNQGAESVVCFIMAQEKLARYSDKAEGVKQKKTGKELMEIYGKNRFSQNSLS